MKNFKITVMAMRGLDQMEIKTITQQSNELSDIALGRVGDLFPLHQDTRIEIWITSEEAEESE